VPSPERVAAGRTGKGSSITTYAAPDKRHRVIDGIIFDRGRVLLQADVDAGRRDPRVLDLPYAKLVRAMIDPTIAGHVLTALRNRARREDRQAGREESIDSLRARGQADAPDPVDTLPRAVDQTPDAVDEARLSTQRAAFREILTQASLGDLRECYRLIESGTAKNLAGAARIGHYDLKRVRYQTHVARGLAKTWKALHDQ